MEQFKTVIAGGGIAAIEGPLRLRQIAGDEIDITLLAPNEDFAFRALSVGGPFAMGAAQRYPVRRIAEDANAELVEDWLSWVDPDQRIVHTRSGSELSYDALLVAVGARMTPAY